mmetsp:Transcript_8676/g.14413  ORF Transcript_8676/g.14413 Transcript_8676/m.14413 type:complete len:249 (+) Transcript_8676:658-1404(+)
MELQTTSQHFTTGNNFERCQEDATDGIKETSRSITHVPKASHGDTDNDRNDGNLSLGRNDFSQSQSHDNRQSWHEGPHDLIEIDRHVSQTDIANGNVERENDGKGPNHFFSFLIQFFARNLAEQTLKDTRIGRHVRSQSTIVSSNGSKDQLRSNGIARHVDKREKVGVLEINQFKGRLVQESDTHIVGGPYYQPNHGIVFDSARGRHDDPVLYQLYSIQWYDVVLRRRCNRRRRRGGLLLLLLAACCC